MQELDTSDEHALPGRHRVPASAVRRLSVRLGIAAVGILVATGLGAATADLLGLSDAARVASEGNPPRGIPQAPEEEPRPGRSIDLTPRPIVPMPQPEDPAADPAPQGPPAAAAPVRAAQPAPAAEPPAPVRAVRTGDSCSAVGQKATTTRGDAAVCTASRGNGPNKWRAA